MPTTITESIGSASRDYATPALWEAGIPANLVTADEVYVGEMYNDSTFNYTQDGVEMTGHTTDATRYYHLKCADGESFMDDPDHDTNRLWPDQANGVYCYGSTSWRVFADIDDDYCIMEGIQADNDGNQGFSSLSGGDNCVIKNCLGVGRDMPVWGDINNDNEMINCVGFVMTNDNACEMNAAGANAPKLINCTILCPSDVTNTQDAVLTNYGTASVTKGCLILGFGDVHNVAEQGDYNVTDVSSATIAGANSIDGVTYADQIEATTASTIDARLKAGSDAEAAGVQYTETDDLDITGQRRSTVTPCIGAFELDLFPTGWTATKVEVLASKVSGSGNITTHFPIDDTSLPASLLDAGASSLESGGGGARISSDALGTNRLPLDIIRCVPHATPASRKFLAWTRGVINGTTDTPFWFWTKDSELQPLVDKKHGRNEVWQDEEFIIDFRDTSGFVDRTGNHPTINEFGSMAAADEDDGQTFDGSNDYLTIPHTASLAATTAISLRAFLPTVNDPSNYTYISNKPAASSHSSPYADYALHIIDNGNPESLTVANGTTYQFATSTDVYPDTDLYMATTWAKNTTAGYRSIIDGAVDDTINTPNQDIDNNSQPLVIGSMNDGGASGEFLDGVLKFYAGAMSTYADDKCFTEREFLLNDGFVTAVAITREQSDYRWYDDDDDEDASTALAAQNTGITRAKGETTQGRAGIQYVGDPPAEAPKWRYRLKSSGEDWEDIGS